MLLNTLAGALFGSLLSVVHSSPVARDNDGARPISWQDPSGQYLCWAVEGGLTAGSQIGVATCDNSQGQSFIYNEGATSIQVSGTSLCVEFGPGLGRNGTPLRLQNCRSKGAPGQRLFITGDAHVALQNGPGQCADVRDAQGPLQSWRCVGDNANQIFNFGAPPTPPDPNPRLIRPSSRPSSCLSALLDLDPERAYNFLHSSASGCNPDYAPRNQFYFNLGNGPQLLDQAGNVYSFVNVSPSNNNAAVSATIAGQPVTVESGTGDFADRVRITIQDGDSILCLSVEYAYSDVRWFACDGPDGSDRQYFYVDPPL